MEEEEDPSTSSSISKDGAVSSNRINSCEESGWTAYFEDLFSDDEHGTFSPTGVGSSSSTVSDASSYPALLKSFKEHNPNVPYSSMPKKSCLNKSKAKEISRVDLEDTASSPVNSPKVSILTRMDCMNTRKEGDHNICSSLGKGGTFEQFSGLQEDTMCERNIQAENNGNANLKKKKKKGLCLVECPF